MIYFLPVWFAFLAGLIAAHVDLRPAYRRLRAIAINDNILETYMHDEARVYIDNEELLVKLNLPAEDIESVTHSTEIKTDAGIWFRSYLGWTMVTKEELGDEYDGR